MDILDSIYQRFSEGDSEKNLSMILETVV